MEQPPVKKSRGFVTRKEAPKFFALRCVMWCGVWWGLGLRLGLGDAGFVVID